MRPSCRSSPGGAPGPRSRRTAWGAAAGWTHDLHPCAAPPWREWLECEEPVHRLGGRPPLREGLAEATRGGELLTAAGVTPDVVHTSLLRRAITSANLALDAADRHWIPVKRSWRLNERHYGAL